MLSEIQRKENEVILKNFLEIRPIEKQYQLKAKRQFDIPFGYVYCIENKLNGKKYVGSTYSLWKDVQDPSPMIQLRKRATQYLYEYNCLKNMKTTARRTSRPITRAMFDEGIENFVMYPIAETQQEYHYQAENFFIDLYDTLKTGYNVRRDAPKSCNKRGSAHTAEGKRLRSEEIISINVNLKKIIISDSMKLFADSMHTSKDIIKNSVRKCRPRDGWHSFYTNWEKREYVINYFILGTALPERDRHSEKSKNFYTELHQQITEYLSKENSELFSDYTIEYNRYTE